MPVPTSINDLSTTANSNSPPGTEAPTLTDDYLRVYASYIAALRDVVLSGTGNLSTANLTYSGTLTGSTGVLNIGAGQIYKDAAGLVGVGTATPQYRLSVATTGDAVGLSVGEAGSATGKTVDIGYYVTANYGRIQAVHAGTGFKDLALNPSGGGVGIGTTAPATRLEVSGSAAIARITGTAGTAPRLELSSAGVVNWSLRSNSASASELSIFQDVTERMRIDSSGNVGIGTSTPGTKLHVNGSVRIDVAVQATNSGAGGAAALPSAPAGYAIINIGGVDRLFPYYPA